jgi:hypothetical protein
VVDVASGVTIGTCYRRHRHQEFLPFPDLCVDEKSQVQALRASSAVGTIARSGSLAFIGNASARENRGEDANSEPRRFR